MALLHRSDVQVPHRVPLRSHSTVRLMFRMRSFYGSRVVCIIYAAILQLLHASWLFVFFHFSCINFLRHSVSQSQVQMYRHFRFNGFRLLTTCSWNKKSSKVNPSFFPGHLISAAEGEYSSHFLFHGKCFGFLPCFEPGQVQRWLPGNLNLNEIKRSLLVHSIHSISDPRSFW